LYAAWMSAVLPSAWVTYWALAPSSSSTSTTWHRTAGRFTVYTPVVKVKACLDIIIIIIIIIL
jgi:hypothetical protein